LRREIFQTRNQGRSIDQKRHGRACSNQEAHGLLVLLERGP